MNPLVVFAIAARLKLEQRLAPQLEAHDPAGHPLRLCMDDIAGTLRAVFRDARVLLVQDLYAGFRVRPGEHILLVEVAESGRADGLRVVKLGPAGKLAEEWDAWHRCRPHGLRHDIVLMGLSRHPEQEGDISALVYDDAEQLIGVDQTLTLESAALAAVEFGSPTVESVADLLFQLYERLGLLFYRHADNAEMAGREGWGPADPPRGDGGAAAAAYLDPHLSRNLALWYDRDGPAFACRTRVTTETDDPRYGRGFRDPALLFRHVARQPRPPESVPHMLRGRSHGDLHGRNVLVGRVGRRVLWPAVFDYGKMGPANWVGLDFAKMETELKIRAYPLVFRRVAASYVVPFEVRLALATEAGRDDEAAWPAAPAAATPEERLFWLLLGLRRLAGAHLGRPPRGGLWLTEYYFQLALYGLNAARFDNLTPNELKGAYLSAGCAAARFAPVPERNPA